MECWPVVDPTCIAPIATDPVGTLIGGSVDEIFQTVAKDMAETAGWAIKTLVTGWLMAPSPIMDNQDVVDNLRKYTYWITMAVAVAALLVAATRMVLQARAQPLLTAAGGLGKLVLITSLSVPLTIALTEFGDGYSRWIINAAVGDGLEQRIAAFVPAVSMSGLTTLAVIGLSLLCILASFVQILMSIAIGGLKIFLCGLAPLPAAASIGGGGQATLARYLTWLLAVLLYKPAAATIYAGAFWMLGGGTSLETVLTGIVVIAGAIVAMPALLRLLAPISAQAAAGDGATIVGSAAKATETVASGAVRLATLRNSSGGSDTGGGASPTAPPSTPPNAAGGGGAPPARQPAATTTGPGSAGAGGGTGPSGPRGGPGTTGAGSAVPAGSSAVPAGTSAAGGGTAAAGAGSVAGGATAGAGAGMAGGATAAGPAGAAIAVGAAAVKAGPAVVRKVGGTASGAAQAGDQ